MFSLEIDFHDGVSPPEILLVRRPHAIVGTSDFAHVVIEGAASVPCDLRLLRGIGREFSCQPVRRSGSTGRNYQFLEGVYNGEAELNLGEITTFITSLDIDFQILPQESPDLAGVRTLRRALSSASPKFPALAVVGASPVFVSFAEDQPMLVGRSRKCGLRLDSSGISGEHARIGFSNGKFWVEDLGSTNGTFVNGEQVSGRRNLLPNERILIGSEFTIACIGQEGDLVDLKRNPVEFVAPVQGRSVYPCVMSKSDIVRPNRVTLEVGQVLRIGRDPANDIWVGAAHISREHATLELQESGEVILTDKSSNGTFVRRGAGLERLAHDESIVLTSDVKEVDLKEGVSLVVCFSQGEEEDFLAPRIANIEKIVKGVAGGSKENLAKIRAKDPVSAAPKSDSSDEFDFLSKMAEVADDIEEVEAPVSKEFAEFRALLEERSANAAEGSFDGDSLDGEVQGAESELGNDWAEDFNEEKQTSADPYLISEETALSKPSVRLKTDDEGLGLAEQELDRMADQLFESPVTGRVILIIAIAALLFIGFVVFSLLITGGRI